MTITAYFGCSIDGFIADRDGGLDWLDMVPNPDNNDLGWTAFMQTIDAILMGRKTFETVINFDCPWPYTKPVFVLSSTLERIPNEYQEYAKLVNGDLEGVIESLNNRGITNLYVDGGKTIQGFIKADLLDELIITTIPVLLGGGIPVFSHMDSKCEFDLVKSEVLLNAMVKSHYRKKSRIS